MANTSAKEKKVYRVLANLRNTKTGKYFTKGQVIDKEEYDALPKEWKKSVTEVSVVKVIEEK